MSEPPTKESLSLDPALLRDLARLVRKAKREYGLAHAATLLKAAIREARDADKRETDDTELRH